MKRCLASGLFLAWALLGGGVSRAEPEAAPARPQPQKPAPARTTTRVVIKGPAAPGDTPRPTPSPGTRVVPKSGPVTPAATIRNTSTPRPPSSAVADDKLLAEPAPGEPARPAKSAAPAAPKPTTLKLAPSAVEIEREREYAPPPPPKQRDPRDATPNQDQRFPTHVDYTRGPGSPLGGGTAADRKGTMEDASGPNHGVIRNRW